MKINNVGLSGMNPYKNSLNKIDSAKRALFTGKDKIEISSTAKDLQQSSQVVTQRQEKVQELKLSVENGTYRLDSKGTAKALMNFYGKK